MKKIRLTEENIESVETISPKVSRIYVPIWTSEIVKAFKPEFELVNGYRMNLSSTKHYVSLANKKGDVIRIYNSFDRTWAFSAYYVTDGIQFPIITDGRIVHKGDKAKSISDIAEIKDAILSYVPKAKELAQKLKDFEITDEMAGVIKDTIFKDTLKRVKEDAEIDPYSDIVVKRLKENGENVSIYSYIKITLKNYIDGNYGIKTEKRLRKGRKLSSAFGEVKVVNALTKALTEKYPEYFI
jgi:hypothetical protein